MNKYFDSNSEVTTSKKLNPREIIAKYLSYWYWFIFSIFVSMTLAFGYLWYTRPVYRAKAVILIKDEKKGLGASNDILKDLQAFGGNKIVENEIEVFKSRNLIGKVVDELGLIAKYYKSTSFQRSEELFLESPISVKVSDVTNELAENPLYVEVINNSTFKFHSKYNNKKALGYFDKSIVLNNSLFVIRRNNNVSYRKGELIKVVFSQRDKIVDYYRSILDVSLSNLKSTVLLLSMEDTSPSKAKAILDRLISVYISSSIDDKNKEASITLQFIEERLKKITTELSDVEKNVEGYKSTNGFTDLSAEASLFLEKVKDSDLKLNEVDIQLKILTNLENYVNNAETAVAPSTSITSDPVLLAQISKLNELTLQKEKVSRSAQAANPILETINTQIASTKRAIRENVQNQKRNLLSTKASIVSTNRQIEKSIKDIPHKEREFLGIKRQQAIKESLYLLLLQKREETALSYASTVSDSRVVDSPYVSSLPVKPNKLLIYGVMFILGLLAPIVLINLRDLFNNKITNRKEIEDFTSLTVVGEIGLKPKEMIGSWVDMKGNSVIAEQFRMLRTNLQFLGNNDVNGKCILLTSSMSGEGKSFVGLNIAQSFSVLGKRTVILELDLRKPKVTEYAGDIGVVNALGITNYLIGEGSIEDMVKEIPNFPNLYLISCGPIPPNPSELLSESRFGQLMSFLKLNYDIIVLDTPPIGLVTDALIISKFADVSLYITRQGYTLKEQLNIVKEISEFNKMPRVNMVLNGIDLSKHGYGYNKYGYGYYGYSTNYVEKESSKSGNFFKS